MLSYFCAYVCIIQWDIGGKFPWDIQELGKQSMQAKEVYFLVEGLSAGSTPRDKGVGAGHPDALIR